MYPNSTQQKISIVPKNESSPFSLTLYDLLGRCVVNMKAPGKLIYFLGLILMEEAISY
ncbi:MAG: hypothetical protein ACI97P_002386 [Arcticibacterium sp.]|jgi:hypothetical protein